MIFFNIFYILKNINFLYKSVFCFLKKIYRLKEINKMGVDYIQIFEKYGIDGLLGFASLFTIISVIKSTWLNNLISKLSDSFILKFMKSKTKNVSNMQNIISDSDIINHDIFSYIDLLIYSKIPTVQFSTEYRTAVFRKYLTIYLKSYKNNILNYITERKYEHMDQCMLTNSFIQLINNIVYEYERNSYEAGIPSIIIEKMKLKNNDSIYLIIDLIENICSSHFYTSEKNLLKIFSILNIFLSILENSISSSEIVCNSINGSLKGLTFDGKIE